MRDESQQHSLAGRLSALARARLGALRAWRVPTLEVSRAAREWQVAAGVAALIAAGPVMTMLGAKLLAGGARAEARRLHLTVDPRVAEASAASRERDGLAAILRRPTLSATIEALARALPPEATLVSAARDRHGLLEVEIAAPDPDRLRAAIRREPALAALHDAGQRRGEAVMIVSLKESAE